MLYYVYIISYTFFFHARPRASRVSIVTSCVKLSFGGIFPLLLLIFFFSLSMRTCTCASIFFSLFFFSDKCHLWFVYKVYVCIIHSYVLRVYALHSCFIHIHIYIYACISVYVYVYACVCVCVDPCVRTRLIHLFIAYHLCRVVTNYTYIVQGFFFFFRPAVAPRVCVQRLHTSPKPKVYATRLPWDPAGRSPNSRKYISKILVFLT